MIYRFDILAESGLYDGWAHDRDEMIAKFKAQFPDEPEPFIFLSGGAPKVLTYAAYKRAQAHELTSRQIEVLEAYLVDLED